MKAKFTIHSIPNTPPAYLVEFRIESDPEPVVQNTFSTKDECRKWITKLKKITKFTKVIDLTDI